MKITPGASHESVEILAKVGGLCWCSIYTRQSRESSDEYSSCQAQLDACWEFVKARFQDGWVCNGHRYEDEAETSESLERPGLQQLMEDIREGKVDRVVIHRLDRLSRRLADCTMSLTKIDPSTLRSARPRLSTAADT